MKLKKILPITALSATIAATAPIGLTSCSQYHYINLLEGFKPSTDPITERQFNNYEEVVQYYISLNKDILMQDYIWSLGEYVKEDLEFPEPIFEFKFKKIDQAIISLEDWWTQPYPDESVKNVFTSSFSMSLQISGSTEPRNSTGPYGSYLPYSNVVLSMTTRVYKFPFTIINKNVGNKTDARWIILPASEELLEKDSTWNVSSNTNINYILQAQLEHSVTTRDSLSIYWHNTNLREPAKQEDASQLLAFTFDSLVYGSYYLKNCTLKA